MGLEILSRHTNTNWSRITFVWNSSESLVGLFGLLLLCSWQTVAKEVARATLSPIFKVGECDQKTDSRPDGQTDSVILT